MQPTFKHKCHTPATGNARPPSRHPEQPLDAKRKQARVSIQPRDLLWPRYVGLAAAVRAPKMQMEATFKPKSHKPATDNAHSPSRHSKQELQAKGKQARVSIPPRDPLWPLLSSLGTTVDVPKFQMQAKSEHRCHTRITGKPRCPNKHYKRKDLGIFTSFGCK